MSYIFFAELFFNVYYEQTDLDSWDELTMIVNEVTTMADERRRKLNMSRMIKNKIQKKINLKPIQNNVNLLKFVANKLI